MLKRLFVVCAVTALMAGCGSSVKLHDTPVEDKTGSAVGVQGNAGAGIGQSGVAPVDLSSSQVGPGPGGTNIVYFDYDSYSVKPDAQGIVDKNASYLKANQARKAVVEGHTDERGGREYNLALGQKRSEAVRRALVLSGVPDSQVEAVSFGKEKPAVEGHTEAAYAQNRRAEITYR